MSDHSQKLNQEYCFTLIGKFMFRFAIMEGSINNALKCAFSIGNLNADIILANVELSRKLNILRSAVAMVSIPWQKKADSDIKEAQEQLEVRNIVAHTIFGPTPDGKVKFLTVKAKSKLQYPDVEWSVEYFEAHFAKMKRLTLGFEEIGNKLKSGISSNTLSSLIEHGLKAMRTA